ncbi:helix-turn-helix domain-containing protein [Yoonia maritima]|uniref:helix-turn-helix domain-containing protein n=1 Tax=Yoonia maritima TaxID=1435347 RepID=UPI0037359D70
MRPISPRREQPSVQRIESPLTRSGYSLAAGRTHLLLLFAGAAQVTDEDAFVGPRLVWLSDGGSELVVESGARGKLLSIPHVSLLQALPATPLGDQMRQTISRDLSAPLETTDRLSELIDGFANEKASGEPGSDIGQAHYLGLILVQIWRLARTDIVAQGRAPQGLAERFVLLASQRVREHWTIDRYAQALSVNRDRLGAAVKRSTGLSPQAYLHRALIREAMELLANTGATVAQIAFRLGFVDPAYFTRFFKRQVGENPGAFRQANRVKDDSSPQSFAAWP